MGRPQIQKGCIGLSLLIGVLLSGVSPVWGVVSECEDRTVCNGDFEQDLLYWESVDNVTLVSGRSGQGAEVAYDGANNDLAQLLPGVFAGGKTYRVTAWCLAEVGEQCGLFLGDANDAYGPPYEHAVWQWGDGTGAWRPIEAELTLSHEERLHVYLYSNVTGSAVMYDDVQVEDVTAGVCNDRTVCNGDFEQGFYAWEGAENATLTSGQSGQGVRITHDEDNSDILQMLPGVFEAGGTYRVTAWCLAAPGELCKLFFGDANPEYGPAFEHAIWQWTEGTGDWQRLSHLLTLSHEERLNVSLAAPQTAAIFDDVQVEELSDTSCEARTVCNGDFELETTSWSSFDNATVVPGRSGQGVQVAFDGVNNDLFQLLPGVFAGGKTYRATAWCLAEEGEQCGLFLGDSNDEYGPPNEFIVNQWLEGDGTWQQMSVVLTLGHEERLNVYLYSPVSGSAVIYDDVQVEAVETYQLTVTKQGCGEGTVKGEGIYCDPDSEYSVDCHETYPDGTVLDLQAVPGDDSEFVGWLVDGEPLQGGEIVINSDITLTAIFEKKPQQVPELEIVGTRSFHLDRKTDSRPVGLLMDSRGELVGSTQFIWLDNKKVENFVFIKDGENFQASPLVGAVVSKNKNRVIVYGSFIGNLNMSAPIRVNIYSITGEPIASVDTEMWSFDQYPSLCVGDNGEFWVAGAKTKTSFLLQKYSPDGDLLWEAPLPIKEPRHLVVSFDNRYVALTLFDWSTGNNEIRFYDENGQIVHAQELPFSFYGVEFISHQKVLLYSADEWELYRLDDLETPLLSEKFRGNPSEIVALPQAESFLIKSFDKEPCREGYRLQAVDAETGQVLAERFFDTESFGDFSFVRTTAQGTVEVWPDGTTVMELRIPE